MNTITQINISPDELRKLIAETIRTEIKGIVNHETVELVNDMVGKMNDSYISSKEAKDLLGICYKTFRKYAHRGDFKSYQVGNSRPLYLKSEIMGLAKQDSIRISR